MLGFQYLAVNCVLQDSEKDDRLGPEWTNDDIHILFDYMLDPQYSEDRLSSQKDAWPHVCSHSWHSVVAFGLITRFPRKVEKAPDGR